MCTVTFMPRRSGYCLAMNRDEKRTRPKGLAPVMWDIDGCRVLYPSEPSGGTWIAVNSRGTSFALINWYSVAAKPNGNAVSRGMVIPSIVSTESPVLAARRLSELPLSRINPFRLVGIFPSSHEIIEWRWDLRRLTRNRCRWRAQQWISSGFQEATAQNVRSRTFRNALTQRSAGSLSWLRRLHRSHVPHTGPFSICMHREDAATVSYTELYFDNARASMGHTGGSACSTSKSLIEKFRLPMAGDRTNAPARERSTHLSG